MQVQTLEGGFDQPPLDAAKAFRAVMEAMARPGTIRAVTGATPPAPLSVAAGVCLLTLCDPETPLHLADSHDQPQVREWITFHTGAPLCDAGGCAFAVGSWQDLHNGTYSLGTAEYPDRSATLIVEVIDLTSTGAVLSGPGIEKTAALSLPEIAFFQRNQARYPLGLDFLFTRGSELAALPRSTQVHPCT